VDAAEPFGDGYIVGDNEGENLFGFMWIILDGQGQKLHPLAVIFSSDCLDPSDDLLVG